MKKLIDYICTNDVCWYSTKSVERLINNTSEAQTCGNCGSPLKRLYSSNVKFNFKGEGFYKQGNNQ